MKETKITSLQFMEEIKNFGFWFHAGLMLQRSSFWFYSSNSNVHYTVKRTCRQSDLRDFVGFLHHPSFKIILINKIGKQ